jgi:hypothetical protein
MPYEVEVISSNPPSSTLAWTCKKKKKNLIILEHYLRSFTCEKSMIPIFTEKCEFIYVALRMW